MKGGLARAGWGLVLLFGLACATASSPAVQSAEAIPASNLAALDAAIPEQVAGFRRTDRRRVTSPDVEFNYRFRDSAGVMISLFVYPTDYPGSESTGDPRTRVEHEGRLLFQLMPIQVQRGLYESFEPLVARLDSAVVAGMVVPAFVSEVRVRRRGTTMYEIQFLHLVGGDFVKLRSTLTDLSALGTLQAFDSALVQRLGRR